MKDERVTSLDGPWMLQSETIPVPTRARVRRPGGETSHPPFPARSTPNQTGPGKVLISEIVPNPESFGTFPFPLPPARAGALSSFLSLAAYRRPLAGLGRSPLYSGHCTACASGVAGLAEMAEIGHLDGLIPSLWALPPSSCANTLHVCVLARSLGSSCRVVRAMRASRA